MYLTWICLKLCLIEDTHHCCSGARQGRRGRIAFHSVVIPLMSYQISRSQVKKQVLELHSMLVGLFWTFNSNKLYLYAL